MAPITSSFLRLLTTFQCPSAQGGAAVGMTQGPCVPPIQMPRLNAIGGLCIWKTLPWPLVGSMNALLLLTPMGQRMQDFNLLSRQKVSDWKWDFAVSYWGGRKYQGRWTLLCWWWWLVWDLQWCHWMLLIQFPIYQALFRCFIQFMIMKPYLFGGIKRQ